jgi:hypothetical protein
MIASTSDMSQVYLLANNICTIVVTIGYMVRIASNIDSTIRKKAVWSWIAIIIVVLTVHVLCVIDNGGIDTSSITMYVVVAMQVVVVVKYFVSPK